MEEVNHKLAAREHFKSRLEERLGVTISKSAMKSIKKRIMTGEIPLWGFKDGDAIRTKHLYTLNDKTVVIVYDRTMGELVTVYPYERHLSHEERSGT